MNRLRKSILIGAILLVAAACAGEDGGDTTVPAGGEETTTTAGGGGGETTTTGAEAMDGIHASETDLGTILVDPDGFALYVFTADTGGESTCYEACADLWPPVSADTEISSDLDASMFGTTTRTDGTEQLTVNGQPLYLYTPDTNPGDTTGQGLNGVWFVVDTSGVMIGGPEASNDTSTTGEDGDYGRDY